MNFKLTLAKILSSLLVVLSILPIIPSQVFALSTPVLVQTAATINDSSGTSISQAFSSANTLGNLIAVTASWGTHTATPTVTDTLGNTYVLATTGYSSAGDQSLAIYYAKNIKAGSNTVTVNFGGSHLWRRVLVAEYSGVSTTNPVDVTAANVGTGTTAQDNVTSTASTTTTVGDLIFGAVENFSIDAGFTAGTVFTLRNSLSDSGIPETGIEDKIQTSAGSVAATFTFGHADQYLAQMVAFKAATSSPDTTPPSVPTSLLATGVSSSQINLSWIASTDNVGVAGYKIFRNAVQVATSTTPSYSDIGLAPSTTYTYTVAAFDAAGNVSAHSTAVNGTTQVATTVPTINSFVASPTSITYGQSSMLSWSVSGSPTPTLSINNGVGSVSGSSVMVSPTTTITYTLTAVNSAGSANTQVTVQVNPNPDTTAPSVPTNLAAIGVSSSQVNLSWNASTDPIVTGQTTSGVAGYKIFRNGIQVATSTTPSYSDTGLNSSTTYGYAIAAYDIVGNVSAKSTSVNGTTQTGSTVPTINMFIATPANITLGQSSTLSWSVSGTPIPTVSINNGIGIVASSSINVSPLATTTYTLTATNAVGSTTAQTAVNVTFVDTTPPSVPTSLIASTTSFSQINLSWTASTDNVGVTGYTIFRNGTKIATSTTTNYSDMALEASTTYTYTVSAFDAAGNVSATSTVVNATTNAFPTTVVYPIKLSSNSQYLTDQANNPFFIVGDSPWSLINELSNEDVNTYLADRASRGFNSIWVGAADNTYQTNAPDDYYGNPPFDGPDFTDEDPAYWAHVDSVIQTANIYGINVMLSPAFVGLDTSSGYLASYENSSDAVMTAYGAWLGNRYKNFPNIVWVLGGDADPANSAVYAKLSDLANGIRSTDPNHLMTFEASRFTNGQAAPNGGYSSLDAWNGAPSWLNLNWVYLPPANIPASVGVQYTKSVADSEPPLLGEDWYEGEHNMTELQVREEGYEAVLGGAYTGRIFGNDDIWTFGVTAWEETPGLTWQSQLGSQGSIGQANLGALFKSRENWKLVPDMNNTVMTTGSSNGSVAARTNDGQSIIAYVPTQQTVTINMTQINDISAKAWWFNPQTASTTLIGTFPTTGSQAFTSPDSNDWVLVIDAASANLPAPGTNVYVSVADTTPPSNPSNLVATPVSASQINLSWTASTDNVGVVGYKIFRNNIQIATTTADTYSDTGLTANTLYYYNISAYDSAGNVSVGWHAPVCTSNVCALFTAAQ